MKELSRLAAGFSRSVIRQMSIKCAAVNGVNLAQGYPDWEAPEELKAAAQKAVESDLNQYAISFGEPGVRQAVADRVKAYNGLEFDPGEEVTITCGATEAVMCSILALANPGDEFIIFDPGYDIYGPDAQLAGAKPVYVPLRSPDWTFDPDELAAAFNENTKAVVVNTPHNPTAKVFTRPELEIVAELCRKWDAYCLTDEVYEHLLYDGAEHISMAGLPGMRERTVTVNSCSKTYSITGWRIGYVLANPDVSARLRKLHNFLTVGTSRPLQEAAELAFKMPLDYYAQLQGRYAQLRDFLFQALQEAGFKPVKPAGAFFMMAQADELMAKYGLKDDFAMCDKLLEAVGVAAVPGSSFYCGQIKEYDWLRFCFCKREETLRDAAERLKKFGTM